MHSVSTGLSSLASEPPGTPLKKNVAVSYPIKYFPHWRLVEIAYNALLIHCLGLLVIRSVEPSGPRPVPTGLFTLLPVSLWT